MMYEKYKDRDHKIVEFETHGERALVIVTRHADVNENEHPYLQVHE